MVRMVHFSSDTYSSYSPSPLDLPRTLHTVATKMIEYKRKTWRAEWRWHRCGLDQEKNRLSFEAQIIKDMLSEQEGELNYLRKPLSRLLPNAIVEPKSTSKTKRRISRMSAAFTYRPLPSNIHSIYFLN